MVGFGIQYGSEFISILFVSLKTSANDEFKYTDDKKGIFLKSIDIETIESRNEHYYIFFIEKVL